MFSEHTSTVISPNNDVLIQNYHTLISNYREVRQAYTGILQPLKTQSGVSSFFGCSLNPKHVSSMLQSCSFSSQLLFSRRSNFSKCWEIQLFANIWLPYFRATHESLPSQNEAIENYSTLRDKYVLHVSDIVIYPVPPAAVSWARFDTSLPPEILNTYITCQLLYRKALQLPTQLKTYSIFSTVLRDI